MSRQRSKTPGPPAGQSRGPAEGMTRTSLDIPLDLYERLKLAQQLDGSTTMRDFILKLLRRRVARDNDLIERQLADQREVVTRDQAENGQADDTEH